jgi:hypothetical protein
LSNQSKKKCVLLLQRVGENSNIGPPGTRTSSVLPDLLSQASPATPPRHDKSSSEEVTDLVFNNFARILFII